MTTLQIVLLAISGAFALASIVFMILFIIEISVGPREEKKEVEVKIGRASCRERVSLCV